MKPLFVMQKEGEVMFKFKKFHILRQLRQEKLETAFNKQVWDARKPLIEIQNQIDEEKKELTIQHIKTKLPSCSKIFAVFLFVNFTILEIFTGWITIKSFSLASTMGISPDFTPFITLVGAVIGQTFSYWIYSSKSKAENTQGGIVYEATMAGIQSDTDNEGGVG